MKKYPSIFLKPIIAEVIGLVGAVAFVSGIYFFQRGLVPFGERGYLSSITAAGILGLLIMFGYRKLWETTLALRENRNLLQNIIDTVPLYIWSAKVADGKEIRLFTSKAVEAITGYPRERMMDVESWWNIIHPDDRSGAMTETSHQHMGNTTEQEYRIIRADGEIRWIHSYTTPTVDEAGRVIRLEGTIEDFTEQKLTREKLRRNESRYRALFDNSPIAIWEEDFSVAKQRIDTLRAENITDFEAYFDEHPEEVVALAGMVKVINVNHAAVIQHEAESKEALLAGLEKTFGEEALVTFKTEILALIRGETSFAADSIVYSHKGTPIHVSVNVTVAPGAENTWHRIIVSTINITDRVQAREQLATTANNLSQAQAIAHVGNWVWDHDTDLITCSDEIFRILGVPISPDALTYDMFLAYVPASERTMVENAVEAALSNPAFKFNLEHPVIRPDGTIRMVEQKADVIFSKTNHPIRMIGTMRDITDQRKMETELRQSEERYRTLVETMPQGIAIAIGEKVVYANEALARILRIDSPESLLVEADPFARMYPEDQIKTQKDIQSLMENPDLQLPAAELRIIGPQGQMIYIEATIQSIIYNGQRAVLAVVSDISDRKQLEEQLRQSQKMEAVGRLAGGIAHDFNNLLTAIIGYTGLIDMHLAPDNNIQQDLQEIKKAANRAAGLVRQLLAFSRQQVIQPRIWHINQTIMDVQKMLRRLIGEDIDLQTFLPDDTFPIRIDPSHVEQIVMNMAINARDAMPDGGRLTIETANVFLDEAYARRHTNVTPGMYVMLAISDNGQGMSADVVEHIFEPFFTTKETGKGTGLGLATVYGIVKQNNGHIWVYSEIDRGTTFKLYFHAEEEKEIPETESLQDIPAPETVTGTETILLAEDEEFVRTLTCKFLRSLGYSVLEAVNSVEALAIAEATSSPIDLLLTDVVMPGGMNGRELAQKLQETSPETAVIFMSGYTDNVIVHHKILDPGLNFIQKPFSPLELARFIRKVLNKQGSMQE